MTEQIKKFGTTGIKIGKYKVGAPIISQSYKDKTPRRIKMVGEICLFVGGTITIIAGACSLPGWIIITGGIATLAGRHIAKMFSE